MDHDDIKLPTPEEERKYYDSFQRGRYTIVAPKSFSSHESIEGKNIVFTGRGPYSRGILVKMAVAKGAIFTGNTISRNTHILVVGEKPGSKLIKAKNEGIRIISMEEFLKEVEK